MFKLGPSSEPLPGLHSVTHINCLTLYYTSMELQVCPLASITFALFLFVFTTAKWTNRPPSSCMLLY